VGRRETTAEVGRVRGQALVELSLLLPVLVLLLVAALDVGRAMYTYITINDAAQAGAEWGARTESQTQETASQLASQVATVVAGESNGFLGGTTFTTDCSQYATGSDAICATDSVQNAVNGNGATAATVRYVTVQVKYAFTPVIQFPFQSIPMEVQDSAPSGAQ